jgi:hypothetical protein
MTAKRLWLLNIPFDLPALLERGPGCQTVDAKCPGNLDPGEKIPYL